MSLRKIVLALSCALCLGACSRVVEVDELARDGGLDGAVSGPQRTSVVEACLQNLADGCTVDTDCISGGCRGEVCLNPTTTIVNGDCSCSPPPSEVRCGCVDRRCTFWR